MTYLLAPLLLILPGIGAIEPVRGPFGSAAPVNPEPAEQVNIEQRVTIRIGPRPAPMPMQPEMFAESEYNSGPAQFQERKMGKCLPINFIMGVQPVTDNKLLLIMTDRRLVTAQLAKGCEARQFYSGFIVHRSADGQICTKRDALLSRSGASCQVTGFRQLVQSGG